MTAAVPRRADRALSDCAVLVTPRSFGVHDPSIRAELEAQVGSVAYVPGPLAGERLVDALADVDGVIAGLDELTGEVLARAPRLRVIARYGVGVDRIDLEAAARHGIEVTTTPGANANAVAELTIALLFALARPIAEARTRTARGEWPTMRGRELAGRTLGLIGLGRIGGLVAAKARALGMRVIAHDPYCAHSDDAELVELERLARESDFVSLHLPLTPETRQCVGDAFLAQMKHDAALVNTARGELVDDAAVVRALERGSLRAAAFDTMATEPPAPDDPLLRRADVVVTPHMGPHTAEAMSEMGRRATQELVAVLARRPATHRVTP